MAIKQLITLEGAEGGFLGTAGSVAAAAKALPALALASPKIVGGAAYLGGVAARPLSSIPLRPSAAHFN
jgi:hypothetical protein